MVIPDPTRLKLAASAALNRKSAKVPVADPATANQALKRILRESPIDAAVDLTNQARYLAEESGPCDGCAKPLQPGQEPGEGPGNEPHNIDGP